MLFSVPWWAYLIVLGIIFSAYMTFRTAKEERELDDVFIEKEGQVYIERMNEEKERRLQKAK
ncbi:sporulation YhaL family protein [Bacillus timonensis]|nr:sporulation YhaL family protein [Bacillus timonensis]